MKAKMKIIAIVAFALAFADDGGSYSPEEWTYGNIYVKEPNEKIALERELLYFCEDEARATFDFVNTTKETVNVPCAFPVVMKVPFKTYKGTARPSYSQWTGSIDSVIWEIALARYLPDPDRGRWLDTLPIEELLSKDKSLRVESYADYLSELDRYKVLESYLDEGGRYGDNLKKAYSGCDIALDGRKIPIQKVGIEVTVEINPKSEVTQKDGIYEGNGEFSCLTVVLHFYHELRFEPSRHARLEVSYAVVSEKSSYRSSTYEAFYDISTGRTWKGSMRQFLVATTMNMEVRNGSKEPELFRDVFNFHLFEDYEPNEDEYFAFTSKIGWDEVETSPYEVDFPRQDFVTGVSASSFLKESFKYYEMADYWRGEKTIKTSDYKPQRSFDSDPYNGWVEGAAGDGKGEWIGFTLTKRAFGPFATNGLARFRHHYNYGDGFDYNSPFYGKSRSGSWRENNRIKRMKLTGSNGLAATLNFRDIYAGFSAPGMPGEQLSSGERRQFFNTIENPVILKPGSYKMEILDVYKGEKYDDTVLGEVWFHEISDALSAFLDAEERAKTTFFTDKITELLTGRLVNFAYGESFMENRLYGGK